MRFSSAALAVALCLGSPARARAGDAGEIPPQAASGSVGTSPGASPSAKAPLVPDADPAAKDSDDFFHGPYRWYGWQVLAVDAVLAGVGYGVGFATAQQPGPGSGPVFAGVVGTLGFFGSGPLIHGLHHRGFVALGDAVLRIGLAVSGFAIGGATVKCHPPPLDVDAHGDDCAFQGQLLGAAVAMPIATALDAALFSWERVPDRRDRADSARSWTFAPTVVVDRGRAGVAIGGTF